MHKQQKQQHTPPLVPMYMPTTESFSFLGKTYFRRLVPSSIKVVHFFSGKRLSDYGVAEITWENGQPAMHGLGRANETLESIVHQATTFYNQSHNQEIDLQESQNRSSIHNLSSNIATSSGKWDNSAGQKKRPRSTVIVHDQRVRNLVNLQEDNISNSGTINSKDNDTTMMTWPSFDSPNQSMKGRKTGDDSACQYGSENQEEECRNEGDTVRSQSSRRGRAAAIHNQSERRRRERINEKMKALQKLVPNANKTDKASVLDEVIDYLKKLQAQIQIMKNVPYSPQQMMMPMNLQLQQQQLQMSMLARMGMGFGLQMGMPGIMPPPPHHPFMVPQTMIKPSHVGATSSTIHSRPSTNTTVPFSDPHNTFLAQQMNMDMYNNMAAFYRQQVSQEKSMGMDSSQPDHIRGE